MFGVPIPEVSAVHIASCMSCVIDIVVPTPPDDVREKARLEFVLSDELVGLCVCACVCMYVYMYVCMYVCMYVVTAPPDDV
jgi:hypothetical protein